MSPDWSKFGYLPPDWSILRMRNAQVRSKIDLIVTTNLPARQANFSNVSLLRSLELENEKTENEDKGFHRSSKNENVRDELNHMFMKPNWLWHILPYFTIFAFLEASTLLFFNLHG